MTTVVDLFAGCGGLSKGFENAGYDIVGAFENWNVAADCYEKNFNHKVFRSDLSDVAAACAIIEKLKPDMIIGGPPCQDFSHAGKRIEAGRANLTESYAAIVANYKPKYFLMENVDRAQKSVAFAKAREAFKQAGYGLTERVLIASYCGVPQRRRRFFCIGILGGKDGELNPYLNRNLADKEMTVRDYLGDSLDTEYYYRHPRNYNRRGVFSIDEPAPTMRGVNRPIPQGYPGHPKDACKIGEGVRPLTTLERALIQTFPADFKWTGSKTDQEQMVGNAVPVNLGKFVAVAIRDYLNDFAAVEIKDCCNDFKHWLETDKGMTSRSAADVISRLNRVVEMQSPAKDSSVERYLFSLEQCDSFAKTSSSVKSQLKRAVKLYFEYRRAA